MKNAAKNAMMTAYSPIGIQGTRTECSTDRNRSVRVLAPPCCLLRGARASEKFIWIGAPSFSAHGIDFGNGWIGGPQGALHSADRLNAVFPVSAAGLRRTAHVKHPKAFGKPGNSQAHRLLRSGPPRVLPENRCTWLGPEIAAWRKEGLSKPRDIERPAHPDMGPLPDRP